MPTQEIINGMIDDLAKLSRHSLEVNDFNSFYINDLTLKANELWQDGLQEMYAQLLSYAQLQQQFLHDKTAHFFNGTQTEEGWAEAINALEPLEAEFKIAAGKQLAVLTKLKLSLYDINDKTSDLQMALRKMQLSIVQQKIDNLKEEITKTLNDEENVIADFKQKANEYVKLSSEHSALIKQAENADSFKITKLGLTAEQLTSPATSKPAKLFTYQKPEGWARWFRFLKEKLFPQAPNVSDAKSHVSAVIDSVESAWAKAKQNFVQMGAVFTYKAGVITQLVTGQREMTAAQLKKQKEQILRPLQVDLQAFLTNWTGLSDEQVKQKVNAYLVTLANKLNSIDARFHPDVQALLAKEFIEKFSDHNRSLRNLFPTEAKFQAYVQLLSDDRFKVIMGEQYGNAIATAGAKFEQEYANMQARDARIAISVMSLDFSADNLSALQNLPQLLQTVFEFGTRSDQLNVTDAVAKFLKFTVIEPTKQTPLQLKLILREEEKSVVLSKKVLQDSLKTLVKAQDFDARLVALRAHYLNVVFNGTDADRQLLASQQLGKFLEAPHKFNANNNGGEYVANQENESPNSSYTSSMTMV